MNIGSKIRDIRNEHNMNQQQFADIFHVTRQTVSNWENNKNYPDLAVLTKMSDTFEVPLDILLKEDTLYIQKVDAAGRKASGRKKIILILLLVSFVMSALCIWGFAHSFEATKDANRVKTATDVKMWVALPGATPSFALTRTFDAEDYYNMSQRKQQKQEDTVSGRIEGDIPAIFVKDNTPVTLIFQDLTYYNLKPDKISRVSAKLFNYSTIETTEKELPFSMDNGILTLKFKPGSIKFSQEDEEWYNCVITVEYTIDGKSYVSMTALTLFE
ncbi:helix-turn-helix domain-containing protein [Anaerovorax odorimutans]|uniref:Helix-turn-helix domain-containing protein n=1 Tax=Anaerovorax odorimutans TaxID=109327 RepID=A0ABT1RR37_9FIRM|nr:helix-turn-helix transcriptional regulator [Anaerovorax odorimutans]MCQ4637621.1 helix-turn-helix domain-containing protein [Anaerovorax odorimutans]